MRCKKVQGYIQVQGKKKKNNKYNLGGIKEPTWYYPTGPHIQSHEKNQEKEKKNQKKKERGGKKKKEKRTLRGGESVCYSKPGIS